MHVLRKAPNSPWVLMEIANPTLKDWQHFVGGYIETVTIAEDAAIICNEEGRLLGLPENCSLCGVDFVGPILVVGTQGDDFCDVPLAAVKLFSPVHYSTLACRRLTDLLEAAMGQVNNDVPSFEMMANYLYEHGVRPEADR